MFELPCGIRLRAFQPSPSTTDTPSDIDSLLAIYNDPVLAPLVTQRFVVPRGTKIKDEFLKAIENDAEMFCIIESVPLPAAGAALDPISVFASAPPPPATPLDKSQPPRVAWARGPPRFLGFTALWAHAERGHRSASFSLVLLPEAQGRGLGAAITRFALERAFVHLNMHRVSLAVHEGNDRAVAVYRKCGFVDEGRARKAIWIAGAWRDCINMGILVEEWEARQKEGL